MAQINKPTDYFNTVLYTGNGSTQSITGVGFQPDWIWGKNRDGTNAHWVNDVIRGVDKRLVPNLTDAEDDPSTDIVTSFDSDGFSLGSNTEGNINADNYVSWNWLAGGTASSNTDGSITSTVSANTTAGFSIVSYTGTGSNATVGHSLNSVPKMIIVKDRSAVKNWTVYHIGVGNDKDILLDATNAENSSTAWNSTTPTSSVFSIGTLGNVNTSSNNYIAYCFAEKKGYSKFGSYTGNGNADGTFVYTGFKPAFIMTKKTDTTSNWGMWDTKRNTFNVSNSIQRADTNDAEVTLSPNNDIDILSNGFKVRSTTGLLNTSGGSYIYMAFAEQPLVGTNDIPATAR
jgi:hypothetical protein